MPQTTLTTGNDTVYLYEGLLGGINAQVANMDLLGYVIDGGAGADRLVVDDSYPSSHFTVTTSADGVTTLSTASGWFSIRNFESIQFKNTTLTLSAPVSTTPTAGNDSLTGTVGNDLMAALAGNDTIQGGAGDDTLDGGAGGDSLAGGTGNDRYRVDSLADTVVEAPGEGTDTIETTVALPSLAANVENLVLSGAAHLKATGNALDNALTGNGGNNVLDGGAGADTMTGLGGNDTYVVNAAGDTVVEAAGGGTDTIRTTVTLAALPGQVENLVLAGSGHINANGNALANLLTGNAGNNAFNGGLGSDTVSYAAARVPVTVSLALTGAQATGAGSDTLTGIENLIGGTAGDRLGGNALANRLAGGGGADTLAGAAGNDILTGGAGADSFVFATAPNATNNVDTITDYDAGGMADRILLDDAVFTALGITGTASGVSLGANATDASRFVLGSQAAGVEDRLIYDATTGQLFYDPTGSINGAADQVQIALLGTTNHPVLAASDFFVI